MLTRRIAGHFNYFGVNGNLPQIRHVARVCEVVWHKWLSRRSQRAPLNAPDALIAAAASAAGAVLVTADRDFLRIPGLAIELVRRS